jgi:hypothetical protein
MAVAVPVPVTCGERVGGEMLLTRVLAGLVLPLRLLLVAVVEDER